MMTQNDQMLSVAVKAERLPHPQMPAPRPRSFFMHFPPKPLSQSIPQSFSGALDFG